MDRTRENTAWLACGIALAGLVMMGILRVRTGLETPFVLAPWLAAAALHAALAAMRLYFDRRVALEEQERLLARQETPDASLFANRGKNEDGDAAPSDPFSFEHARAQFNRWGVGLLPPLIALGLGAVALNFFRRLALLPPPAAFREAYPAAAVLAGQGFLLFLFSRYLLGMARVAGGRALRAPGLVLGLLAPASAAAAMAAVAAGSGVAGADRALAWVITVATAVLATEGLLLALVEVYRPRRTGELNTSAESRIARLLVEPGAWVRGTAETLDYQFGFKISATWLYKFLRQALLPLLCFQLAALYLLSSFVFIAPDEEAVIERWGRPRDEAAGGWRLEPGAHLKRPWPFETIRRFPARRVLSMNLGYEGAAPDSTAPILWTRAHYANEDRFLVASATAAPTNLLDSAVPVNLLSFNIPLHYRISSLRDFAYRHADPVALLRDIAYRSLTREAVSRDLFDVMGPGQQEMAAALRRRIQDEADRLHLGVTIEFVGLQGAHPPVQVAEAYESVVGALEEREAQIHDGRAYAAAVLPAAAAEAESRRLEAVAYRVRRGLEARAEADQFVSRKTGCDLSPEVFRNRYRLDTVRRALKDSRLYVVAAGSDREVLQFNFEDKATSSLFDLSPPTENKKP